MINMKQPESTTLGKKQFFRHDPLTSILVLLLVFFASQLIAGVLVALYPALQNWTDDQSVVWLRNSSTAQFAYMLIAEAIAIISVLKILRFINIRRQSIGLVRPKWADPLYALVGYGLYFIAYIAVIIITQIVFKSLDLDQEQQVGFKSAYDAAGLLMAFASLVILPPLAEEIMFRGFLFGSLRAKYNFRTSVIVTGIIFGIAHLQFGSGAPLLWVAAIDTFVLSFFLCWLREHTGSLWPSIFLHSIKNCIAYLLLFGQRFL